MRELSGWNRQENPDRGLRMVNSIGIPGSGLLRGRGARHADDVPLEIVRRSKVGVDGLATPLLSVLGQAKVAEHPF